MTGCAIMPTSGTRAGSALGKKAGGRWPRASATRLPPSSAPRPANCRFTRTLRSPRPSSPLASISEARAIVERAHRVGAHVILDCFQAAGTIPVDVRGLGVDFAVGGVLKWLCGGPGVAYLYVREDLRSRLRPALTGWLAHRQPFAFEPG